MPDENTQARTAALARFLAEIDEACPSCGYSLRGLTGTACPECNQQLELAVRLAEPRIGAFVLGLAGVCVGSGFCTLTLAWGLSYMIRDVWSVPLRDLLPLAIGTVLGPCLLVPWVKARRRLQAVSSARRWSFAVAISLPGLMCAAIFMAMVR